MSEKDNFKDLRHRILTNYDCFNINEYKDKYVDEVLNIFKDYSFKNIYYVKDLNEYISFISSLTCDFEVKVNVVGNTNVCGNNNILGKKEILRKIYVFRGISKVEQLKPTLLRYNGKDNEFEYIRKFEENGSLRLGQFNNPIDLVSAAQHYGIRTRLLDYTYSPLIASLFALRNNEAEYYALIIKEYDKDRILKGLPNDKESSLSLTNKCVYSFHKFDLIKRLAKTLNDEIQNYFIERNADNYEIKDVEALLKTDFERNNFKEIEKYARKCFEDSNYINLRNNKKENLKKEFGILKALIVKDEQTFIKTNYSNERIEYQRGVFDLFDEVSFDDKSIVNRYKDISMLIINRKARDEIIKYINTLGINYYTLANDPATCAEIINDTIENKIVFDRNLDSKRNE